MRALSLAGSAALAAIALACTPPIPEGQYVCADAVRDCPPGWVCAGNRCYSAPPPFDAGPAERKEEDDAAGQGEGGPPHRRQGTQYGFRFSRKARIPSCPSAVVRISGAVVSAAALADAQRQQYVRYRDEIVPQAVELERMAEDAYRLGQTGISAYLQALQSTRDVRLRSIQAAADFQSALADLEQAIGVPNR